MMPAPGVYTVFTADAGERIAVGQFIDLQPDGTVRVAIPGIHSLRRGTAINDASAGERVSAMEQKGT
jgi:predicted transcriptional regulator